MGNDSSRPDNDQQIDIHGWRILHVFPDGPSGSLNIIPYFECITHIDNVLLSGNEQLIIDTVKINQTATYTLYNIVKHTRRDVQIYACQFASGSGLLGLMIRYQNMSNWSIECIHIIDVYAGSPAAAAGLSSNDDYLLGTSNLVFRGYNQLDNWLSEHQDRASAVYVYNSKRNSIRLCTIKPTKSWSTGIGDNQHVNNSSLGADVGVGYLHAIPIDNQRDIIIESNIYNTTNSIPQSQVNELPITGLHNDTLVDKNTMNTSQSVQHPAHLPSGPKIQSPAPAVYTPPPFKPIPQQFVPTSAHNINNNNQQQQPYGPSQTQTFDHHVTDQSSNQSAT